MFDSGFMAPLTLRFGPKTAPVPVLFIKINVDRLPCDLYLGRDLSSAFSPSLSCLLCGCESMSGGEICRMTKTVGAGETLVTDDAAATAECDAPLPVRYPARFAMKPSYQQRNPVGVGEVSGAAVLLDASFYGLTSIDQLGVCASGFSIYVAPSAFSSHEQLSPQRPRRLRGQRLRDLF